jgi:hypothetical protein
VLILNVGSEENIYTVSFVQKNMLKMAALLILLNLTGNSLQIVICVFSEAHYVSAK